jgi:hypothetical protein
LVESPKETTASPLRSRSQSNLESIIVGIDVVGAKGPGEPETMGLGLGACVVNEPGLRIGRFVGRGIVIEVGIGVGAEGPGVGGESRLGIGRFVGRGVG